MRFEEAFEQAVPELIAAAWDFADRSDAIELIWIYLSKDGDWTFSHPYYKVAGKPIKKIELVNHIPGLDVGADTQNWMLDRLNDSLTEIIRAMDNPDDFPRRIIIKFRPSDQDLTAEFYHGNLPDEDQLDEASLFENWIDRLKTTGNDSAQP